jgi:NADH dehydrogenase [ubiquinone] 1 alpha subcomplex assembly factor 6
VNPEPRAPAPALLAEARRYDPERTLCLLFAPAERRSELAALVLLNHELARVAEIVRQPLTGAIRLRFWRDQLALAAGGGRPDLPIARALAPALRDGRLTLAELEALIEARERELDALLDPAADPGRSPPTVETIEAWVRATAGGLARAMGRLLEAPDRELAAAEEAGTAHGLVGIVRATFAEAGRSRRPVTRSLLELADHRSGHELDEGSRVRLRALTEPFLARAAVSIAAARRAGRSGDRARLAPLLLATIAETRLRRLRRLGRDPLRAAEAPRSPLLPIRLLLAWAAGRP